MFRKRNPIHPALGASELAAAVPADELQTLDRLATTIHVAAGEEILRKDELGRECFVVIDGQFEIRRDGTSIHVGPGSIIGELALLTRKPRNASVTAITDANVYVLTSAEFATMLDTCPNIARYVLHGAVRRSAA